MATAPYNPNAYVPGGSSMKVARAIQNLGYSSMKPKPAPAAPSVPGPAYVAPTPAQSADFYAGVIRSNPGYIQGSQDLRAAGIAQDASAAENARRALVEFGYVPDTFSDPYGWADPQTRALAQQNTAAGLSTYARVQRAHQTAVKQLRRRLAARGMLQSGGLNSDLANEDLVNRQNLADSFSKLLSYTGDIRSQVAANALSREQQLQNLAAQYQTWASQYAAPKVSVYQPRNMSTQPWTSPLAAKSAQNTPGGFLYR